MSNIIIDWVNYGKMDYFTVADNVGEMPSIKLIPFSDGVEKTGEENTANPAIHARMQDILEMTSTIRCEIFPINLIAHPTENMILKKIYVPLSLTTSIFSLSLIIISIFLGQYILIIPLGLVASFSYYFKTKIS